jgi:hypothetical protein
MTFFPLILTMSPCMKAGRKGSIIQHLLSVLSKNRYTVLRIYIKLLSVPVFRKKRYVLPSLPR